MLMSACATSIYCAIAGVKALALGVGDIQASLASSSAGVGTQELVDVEVQEAISVS
jgi:hypothetical protein